MNPEYLGDGIYASFDGEHIILRVGDHRETLAEPTSSIYLNNDVMKALKAYEARISAWVISQAKERTTWNGITNN